MSDLPQDWPNRASSRFVRAAGLLWHVQVMGAGPAVLLVHGTGTATHSWRGLAPVLAERFTVVAPDLPGHGFSELPAASMMSVPGIAAALHGLLEALQIDPALVAGHSAGAAILMRMCLDGDIAPKGLVTLNGAMQPFGGFAGALFSPFAKLMAGVPFLADFVAWQAHAPGMVEHLLDTTGSRIDAEGMRLYASLIRTPRHAAAALAMMTNWDLQPLVADMPRLTVPMLLIAGGRDYTVPPSESEEIGARVPGAQVRVLPGLGHLAHEEAPGRIAALIEAFARRLAVLA